MKKLPIFIGFIALFLFVFVSSSFAQVPVATTPTVSPVITAPASTSAQNTSTSSTRIAEEISQVKAPGDAVQIDNGNGSPDDENWTEDANVTFVGKSANRAGDFLDWTLRNYGWACVTQDANNADACNNSKNPLIPFWALVRNVMYALLVIVVLVAAFVMIITRGRNLTIQRFIPRFILIIVLITLSYSLVQFLYQIADIVQGFLLKPDNKIISTRDLIFIGFDYESFIGLRRVGIQFDESAFMTLLLVRLTAITYYVMTGILLIRKIILWFFIILSPVFPLLLFFKPVRNTGKIWIGEFFRWLLYGPLFALFLHGLVVLWRSTSGIPLPFDFSAVEAGKIVYPTSVNILIGGPGQAIGYNNSVNVQDTFALYVVALLMLWVVILLPFLLLKIFLDYMGNLSLQENTTLKRMWDRGNSLLPKPPPAPTSPAPTPPPAGAGLARALPFNVAASKSSSVTNNIYNNKSVNNITSIPANAQILQLANLSVPKMRDIAKFETSSMSHNASRVQEANRIKTSLQRIANPASVMSTVERDRYSQVREKLVEEKQKGNVLAGTILNAANATQGANAPAGSVHVPGAKATVTNMAQMNLPAVNKVQQVSIEDYEEVRKMWIDTYQNSEPPTDLSGKQETREEWVKSDIDKINQAVNMLSSVDPVKNNEGMEMVSNILPFLMVGGFSKTEVIAYLKAKLEAAKQILSGDNKKKEEEDTLLDTKTTETTAAKHMSTAAEAEIEDPTKKPEEPKKPEL